jgi:hypothetical protein
MVIGGRALVGARFRSAASLMAVYIDAATGDGPATAGVICWPTTPTSCTLRRAAWRKALVYQGPPGIGAAL